VADTISVVSVEVSPDAGRPQAGAGRQRSGSPLKLASSSPKAVLIALVAAAAALRFGTLNVQSIWLDESATLLLVHRGFSGMLSHLSESESSPPLYYVLVWAWAKVFGAGPLGFRSLSALVGTLTVPVMYLAGRSVSTRVGLWAAALAAFNPAMFYYSQEARCYGLLILFSAGALVLWQRSLKDPSARNLWLWALLSALALLTHYFAVFLFVPETLMLIRRLDLRRTLAPAGAVALVGLALAPLAASQHSAAGKTEWIEANSLVSRIGETGKEFLVGVYGPLEILTALLCALLALAAMARLVRRAPQRERGAARDLTIVAGVAMALPLLAAASHAIDVFDGRNVIEIWAPAAVVLAIGLGGTRAGRTGTALGVGLCAISLAVIASSDLIPGYRRDDWRGAARALSAAPVGGRLIVTEPNGSAPLSIYLPSAPVKVRSSGSTREVDFVVLRQRRTGRSPLAPTPPTKPPSGFRLAGVRKTETYAVSRFLAERTTAVSVKALEATAGTQLEVSAQP
jgi:mannosyltransferase